MTGDPSQCLFSRWFPERSSLRHSHICSGQKFEHGSCQTEPPYMLFWASSYSLKQCDPKSKLDMVAINKYGSPSFRLSRLADPWKLCQWPPIGTHRALYPYCLHGDVYETRPIPCCFPCPTWLSHQTFLLWGVLPFQSTGICSPFLRGRPNLSRTSSPCRTKSWRRSGRSGVSVTSRRASGGLWSVCRWPATSGEAKRTLGPWSRVAPCWVSFGRQGGCAVKPKSGSLQWNKKADHAERAWPNPAGDGRRTGPML